MIKHGGIFYAGKGMDKGQKSEFSLLNERMLKGGDALISFDSILNTTLASFGAIESLKQGKWINL